MSTMTEQQLTQQEQLDADVYDSNRSLYEHLLLRTFSRAKQGEDVATEIGVLVENYVNMSNSCQRMVGLHRRASNVVTAAKGAADALSPANNGEEAAALDALRATLACVA